MGWDFSSSWQTKEQLCKYLNSNQRLGRQNELLGSKAVGRVLWQAVKFAPDVDLLDGSQKPEVKLIVCNLLDKQAGFGWGYKDMDETMHPFYYSCPASLVKLCDPPSNDNSREWRKVWEAMQNLKAGDIVINSGERYELKERYPKKPRAWLVKKIENNNVYWMGEDDMTPERLYTPPPEFKKMVDLSQMPMPEQMKPKRKPQVDLFGVEVIK